MRRHDPYCSNFSCTPVTADLRPGARRAMGLPSQFVQSWNSHLGIGVFSSYALQEASHSICYFKTSSCFS